VSPAHAGYFVFVISLALAGLNHLWDLCYNQLVRAGLTIAEPGGSLSTTLASTTSSSLDQLAEVTDCEFRH
jgi:hypothetical protein